MEEGSLSFAEGDGHVSRAVPEEAGSLRLAATQTCSVPPERSADSAEAAGALRAQRGEPHEATGDGRPEQARPPLGGRCSGKNCS